MTFCEKILKVVNFPLLVSFHLTTAQTIVTVIRSDTATHCIYIHISL